MLAIPPNVWQPNFTSENYPITIHDSVILHDSTVVAMAISLATPRDQALLADRSDFDAINNSLAYIIQGVVSTSDLARRLYVGNEEMKILRNQIGVSQQLLKSYKQKHMELKQENTKLKKLVLSYAEDLGPNVLEMERNTEHFQRQHEKIQANVQSYSMSLRPSSS
jgi:hypothetical protein